MSEEQTTWSLCVIGHERTAEERILKSHYLGFSDVIEHHGGWERYQEDFLLLKTLFRAFVSLIIIGFLKKMAVFTEEEAAVTLGASPKTSLALSENACE